MMCRFMYMFFLVSGLNLFAVNNHVPTANNEQASKLKQNLTAKFIENKGQMSDGNGGLVPFVLFRAQAPGVNLYITENGLVVQMLKIVEEEEYDEDRSLVETEIIQQESAFEDERVAIEWERIDILLKGANIKKENVVKEGASLSDYNFFYPHCPDGVYGVKEYEKITITNVYNGIDWVFYNSNDRGFKYDFIVHEGADSRQIELLYRSQTPISINEKGELKLITKNGVITENMPISFLNGKELTTNFFQNYQKKIRINDDSGFETSISFSFNSPIHNTHGSILIIDPQLVWGTFYSGSNSLDGTMSIETDANDNVYIAGYAGSIDFPTSNPLGGAYFQGTNSGVSDITIMKFSNTGVLLWATYYGGSVNDISASLAIDINGNVFVTGYTQSVDFPTFNPGASAYFQVANGGSQDIFILKFNTVGLRLWATYYGGSANDRGNGIAIDSNGNSYITGSTSSANFPVLNPLGGTYFQGAYAGGFGELFIVKCSNTGVLLWATYYGGSGVELGSSITTDLNNNILITGYTNSVDFPLYNPLGGAYFQAANAGSNEIIILKFSDIGIPLWATYYGGSSSEIGSSIATDNIGNVFVMGQTNSSDFPTYNPSGCSYFQGTNAGGSDAAIIKFSNTGVLLWATYYGGSANENFFTNDNIAIDHCNNIYISFFTNSTALPFQAGFDGVGYHDNTYNGENSDIFIVLFSNTGVQLWNTYIGGDGRDMREALATDVNNNLFVTGEWRFVTNSASYPVVNPGGGAYYDATSNTSNDDSFILKFTPSNSPFAVNTDITLPTCTNPCTGTATVAIANQSTCAYSYLWSNGETSQTTSGLCTGTYSVTVTNLFCKDTVLIVTISGSGGSLTLIGNQTDTTCAASGAASVTVIGGNSPYTYQWNPSGQTSPIATGLSSGIYTVTVSDAVGCSSSTTVVVVKPTPLVAQYTKGTAACANCGCQEWILVNAISGTVPYTYLWPDGYNKRYKNKLCPGNYTVKVTDKNGCSVDVNVSTP